MGRQQSSAALRVAFCVAIESSARKPRRKRSWAFERRATAEHGQSRRVPSAPPPVPPAKRTARSDAPASATARARAAPLGSEWLF